MSGFTTEWLTLRESADRSARDTGMVERLAPGFAEIVDLGSGTGSNLRWLAPRLGESQQWTLVDNDAALLGAARRAIHDWAQSRRYAVTDDGEVLSLAGPGFACSVRMRTLDLSRELDALELPAGCLVTASALFDLVGRKWLERLVARIAASRASALWTLSYDGTVVIDPALDGDRKLVSLVNRHQHTDKGFGPALGPDAWRVAADLLAQAGFEVATAESPWLLGHDDRSLLVPLITGWAAAAVATAPAEAQVIDQWCRRRLADVERGVTRVTVGHRDVVARPRAS